MKARIIRQIKGIEMTQALFGRLVVVLGGSGFVGRHVAQALLRQGARVRIASRHPERSWAVRVLGDVGQVEFARADVTRIESVERALAGADAVVNLVGAFGGDLDAVQGGGVRAIAQAAGRAGAGAFVHVSAIGADAGSGVAYARTKGLGEAAALAGFAGASVLRPSVIFGPDDNFLNMFGRMMALLGALPVPQVMPVFVPGGLLQPVYVDDVAAAVLAAVLDPKAFGGRTFELGGPEVLTMLELNRRIAAAVGRGTRLLSVPDGIAGVFAALPGTPISRDQIALLKAGSVVAEGAAGFAELGLVARPLGLFLEEWMRPFWDGGVRRR